jgi:hypothetical protein
MEVRFKATYAGLVDVYQAGQVYDVDKAFAERLLNAGEAELVEKKKETNTATKKV